MNASRLILLTIAALVALALSLPAAGQVIYVDGSVATTGNGESWATAYKTLQEGLADAFMTPGQQIWVAANTYTPHASSQSVSFDLPVDTRIFGGFPPGGGDQTFDARDIFANPTILSGNINNPLDSSDNSHHVVTVSNMEPQDSPRFDGFIIENGNANGGGDDDFGGGLFIKDANVWIVNCRFESNRTTQGSAVAVVLSEKYARLSVKPLFVNCDFIENISSDHSQIYNEGNITLNNCCFEVEADDYQEKDIIMNRSLDGGETSADFYDCTFNGSATGKRAMDS